MSKKQQSIGRLKTVTSKDGNETHLLEITQDVVLKQNDVIFLNDYVDSIDFLVKANLITPEVGLTRKTGAKQTTKTGSVVETKFVAMLQLAKREENKSKFNKA